MSVALLWLVLLLVAVGLPLIALYLDRHAAASAADLPEDAWAFNRRHGLSPDEAAAVARSLRSGLRAEDARLRPLVVERAQADLGRRRWPRTAAGRRVALVVLALIVAGLVTWVILDPPDSVTPYFLVLNPSAQFAFARYRLSRLRLAVERNSA